MLHRNMQTSPPPTVAYDSNPRAIAPWLREHHVNLLMDVNDPQAHLKALALVMVPSQRGCVKPASLRAQPIAVIAYISFIHANYTHKTLALPVLDLFCKCGRRGVTTHSIGNQLEASICATSNDSFSRLVVSLQTEGPPTSCTPADERSFAQHTPHSMRPPFSFSLHWRSIVYENHHSRRICQNAGEREMQKLRRDHYKTRGLQKTRRWLIDTVGMYMVNRNRCRAHGRGSTTGATSDPPILNVSTWRRAHR